MLVDKNNVEKVSIPHEAGQWIGLVALTGKEMDAAKVEAVNVQLTRFKPFLKEFAEIRRAADEAASDEEKPESYDLDMLLSMAVKTWSYSAPVTEDALDDLDRPTREWLHRVIWERNCSRPLMTESA